MVVQRLLLWSPYNRLVFHGEFRELFHNVWKPLHLASIITRKSDECAQFRHILVSLLPFLACPGRARFHQLTQHYTGILLPILFSNPLAMINLGECVPGVCGIYSRTRKTEVFKFYFQSDERHRMFRRSQDRRKADELKNLASFVFSYCTS